MAEGLRDVALVSVSIDLGAGRRGVDMGPSALRIAGITQTIEELGYTVRETGTVTAGGFETTDHGESKMRFLDEIVEVARRVGAMVGKALADDCLPLLLGGDHSLSAGSVGAVAHHFRALGGSIGVIWVDAHADMNRPETTPSGNIHGMPLAHGLGIGHKDLLGISEKVPMIDPSRTVLIGIRDLDPGEGPRRCL